MTRISLDSVWPPSTSEEAKEWGHALPFGSWLELEMPKEGETLRQWLETYGVKFD